jgi:glutamyl-tRNA synthetase
MSYNIMDSTTNLDIPVRVRFAPSPTGHLHVGGLRTALFNWLFARHAGGTFLIRIEDTDPERSKPEYTKSILQTFEWVSISSDEPVVIQSQRVARHRQVVDQMVADGTAYRCFCTPVELQARLGVSAAQEGGYTKYDQRCRFRVVTQEDLNQPFAIRFKLPENQQTISFTDLIYGDLNFDKDQFDDFIIIRSDGTPMYNFVVVVDDADAAITHVLRGEDHISNTPKQILLYQACRFKVPSFGHLPSILGPSGHRLSKRDAATAVLDYKHNGFLPDVLCNYLVRLGWSYGDQEIFTRNELITYFSLDHVSKKGAIFDSKKLEWLNGIYMRHLSARELLFYIERDIDVHFTQRLSTWSNDKILYSIELYKDRVKTLTELMSAIESLHAGPSLFQAAEIEPWLNERTRSVLKKCQDLLVMQEDFSPDALSILIKTMCDQLHIPLPQVAKPLRIALTGKSSSPGIFEILALLGKTVSSTRLRFFRQIVDKESIKKH